MIHRPTDLASPSDPDLRRRGHLMRDASGLLALAAWPLATVRAQTGAAAATPAASADARGGPPAPQPGTPLPLPEIPMLDGSTFHPDSVQGQVLVLYWWASWCPFCAEQSPLMEQLWTTQRQRGLRLLGLSIDKKPEEAIAHRTRKGYTFPSGWVSPAVAKALPKPKGLPVTIVRGRDARVLMAETGQLFPEDVAQIPRFL